MHVMRFVEASAQGTAAIHRTLTLRTIDGVDASRLLWLPSASLLLAASWYERDEALSIWGWRLEASGRLPDGLRLEDTSLGLLGEVKLELDINCCTHSGADRLVLFESKKRELIAIELEWAIAHTYIYLTYFSSLINTGLFHFTLSSQCSFANPSSVRNRNTSDGQSTSGERTIPLFLMSLNSYYCR